MALLQYNYEFQPALVDLQEKRRQQMIEIEKQIHETELQQQALAATASKQRIDLMDRIRVVNMKINVYNYTTSVDKFPIECELFLFYLMVQWVRSYICLFLLNAIKS